ncbi:cyd operon protein YbgE [Pseudomonas sp. BAY1663]|nr:cyd operon protein YbgE [Pseudomonas sp. BAY1663]
MRSRAGIGMAADWLYRPASRALSLLLVAPLALLLLIHPAAMLDSQGGYSHPLLMLVMWGISAGFVHGLGFVPQFWLWRWLLGPLPGWTLAALGYLILWQAQR